MESAAGRARSGCGAGCGPRSGRFRWPTPLPRRHYCVSLKKMETQLDFFRENGYCVAHGALSPDEIEHILEGIAADTDANPELWQISEARRNGVGAPSVGADARRSPSSVEDHSASSVEARRRRSCVGAGPSEPAEAIPRSPEGHCVGARRRRSPLPSEPVAVGARRRRKGQR